MANPLRKAAREITLAPGGRKASDLTWYGDRGWQVLRGGPASKELPLTYEQMVYDAFRRNGVVAACIRIIAGSLAEAPIQAYKPGDTEETWVHQRNHQADELFRAPNPIDDQVSFIEKLTQHFYLGGNAYWEKVRSGSRRVIGLKPIRPDLVLKVTLGDDDAPLFYTVRKNAETHETRRIKADDIVHFPDVDPLNDVFGVPRLLAAVLDTHTDNKASEYVGEVLSNHGSPGLLIGVDPSTKPGQIEQAEERWEEKYGAGRGRGKVGFVPGASTVREIGFNLTQLEFPNLRAISRETICAVFGVDPLLISIGSAARAGSLNGTEAVAALRRLWTQTLIPLIRRIEARLQLQLAPEFGEDVFLYFETDTIEALQEPRNEAIKRAKLMKETGVYVIGEIRRETGHDPELPEDGVVIQDASTVLVPASYINDADTIAAEREEDRELSQSFAQAEGAPAEENGEEGGSMREGEEAEEEA